MIIVNIIIVVIMTCTNLNGSVERLKVKRRRVSSI